MLCPHGRVFREDFGENKPRCNGIVLYLQNQYQQKKHGKKYDKTFEKIFVKQTVIKRLIEQKLELIFCEIVIAFNTALFY